METSVSFRQFMQDYQQRVRLCLETYLPSAELIPHDLHHAMRYATLGGGKRLRALLAYATGLAVKADIILLDRIAVSLELVHAFSLIHDDLPCMDNDDLRHGQPSCHKAFNEALAILAGDALQSLAFEVLTTTDFPIDTVSKQLQLINTLAGAIGSAGMAGGQALDLDAENKQISYEQLETIHRLKTAALINASIRMGAMAGQCTDTDINALCEYGRCIGLAFQIQDDILDSTSNSKTLGKSSGVDAKNNKATYVTLLGLSTAHRYAQQFTDEALLHLQKLSFDTSLLREIALFIINRIN